MGVVGFTGLPPEVISGQLYAGAGPGPLTTAAAAWDRVAAQWSSAKISYQAVITELTDGPWQGPAAAAMATAAQRYVAWMQTLTEAAEQTANRVRLAVAAYQRAFAAVVPPAVVAANRAALASLVSGNVFGQNSALIAANQAQYEQMSAQDIAAMYDYAAASAAATELPSFPAPPQTTDPAATGTQPSTVTQTVAPAAASSAQGTLTDLLQSNPLEQFLNNPLFQGLEQLSQQFSGFTDFAGAQGLGAAGILLGGPVFPVQGAVAAAQVYAAVMAGTPGLAASVSGAAPGFTLAGSSMPVVSGAGSTGLAGAQVSAGLGRATPLSGLSVPPSWGAQPVEVRLTSAAMPTAGLTTPAALAGAGLPAPGGWAGGVPPVGGVINAPRYGESPARAGADPAAPPRSTGAPAAATAAPGQPAFLTGLQGASSERDELNRVREAVAELRKTREALKRSAAAMIREARRR